MRHFSSIALAMLTLCLPLGVARAEPSPIGQAAVEHFIVPGYAALVETATAEQAAFEQLCAMPGEAALDAARAGFRDLVTAWSHIELVRFGPVLADNRIDRILFWPDRRGIALRQIQGLLVDKDAAALEPENLRRKSVALQGLGSLEYVLFGTGAEELATPNDYRCGLGLAIAGAIRTTAEEVLADWQTSDSIAAHMTNPVPENADYRSNDEVLSEVLGIFIHGYELIRDVRLGPITAFEENAPNARVALYRRSEMTLESAAANVAGLAELFEVSGLEAVFTDDMSWVAGAMDFEFGNFATTADQIADLPIEAVVADEEAQGKLTYLRIVTQSLQTMAVQQIAVSLGLSAGFSSLDGD